MKIRLFCVATIIFFLFCFLLADTGLAGSIDYATVGKEKTTVWFDNETNNKEYKIFDNRFDEIAQYLPAGSSIDISHTHRDVFKKTYLREQRYMPWVRAKIPRRPRKRDLNPPWMIYCKI